MRTIYFDNTTYVRCKQTFTPLSEHQTQVAMDSRHRRDGVSKWQLCQTKSTWLLC